MDEIIHCCRLIDHGNPQILAELLGIFDYQHSLWIDREGGKTCHTLYCSSAAEAAEAAETITALLPEWQELGVEVSDIETISIKKEDWSEVWKKYFSTIHISSRLVINPSWIDYQPPPGEIMITIDPGMSFGTGQHATTAFCLKMIDRLADGKPRSFLDAGCGSGILSIAAAKLGYSPLTAFDIDADAVMIAGENLKINGISKDILTPQRASLEEFAAPHNGYDLVAANILGHILAANHEKIVSLVKPGGYLILAGIMSDDFAATTEPFKQHGFQTEFTFTEKEWTSGMFKKVPEQ